MHFEVGLLILVGNTVTEIMKVWPREILVSEELLIIPIISH